jgi:hypothetical protein
MRPGLGWTVFATLCVTAGLLAVLLPDVLRAPALPEPLDPKAFPPEPSAEAYGRVPPEWRERHYLAVQEAVLRDLLDSSSRFFRQEAGIAVCVAVGLDSLRTPGPTVDAPLELRRRLAKSMGNVLPQSRCRMNERDSLVDPKGNPAVEIAVGQIHRVSEGFVKTNGYILRGGLAAVGFSYTLSLQDGKWRPDRVVPTWVS